MIRFASDYQEGCHPRILERLVASNLEQTAGYGEDPYCVRARQAIRQACQAPDATVMFLVGGTQTNAVVLHALTRPWEAVIAADTGHVLGHEAGAIEARGHRIYALPNHDGKLQAHELRQWVHDFKQTDHGNPHMAQPAVVYISQPTELGTLYRKSELEALKSVCDDFGLKLFIDGARLAYALGCQENDVTLADLAELSDAFYIGGTKCGGLVGEAVVAKNPDTLPHFFTLMKQQGAVLAKGRLLGITFETLFTDGLYQTLGQHAIYQANRIRQALICRGYAFYSDSPTNQIFVRMRADQWTRLQSQFVLTDWGQADGSQVARIVTSWATTDEQVDALIAAL